MDARRGRGDGDLAAVRASASPPPRASLRRVTDATAASTSASRSGSSRRRSRSQFPLVHFSGPKPAAVVLNERDVVRVVAELIAPPARVSVRENLHVFVRELVRVRPPSSSSRRRARARESRGSPSNAGAGRPARRRDRKGWSPASRSLANLAISFSLSPLSRVSSFEGRRVRARGASPAALGSDPERRASDGRRPRRRRRRRPPAATRRSRRRLAPPRPGPSRRP